MEFVLRAAERKDCPRMLELIRELAEYEKAPQEVTVTPEHFEESGFGNHPVYWAYVVEVNEPGHPDHGLIVGFALYYIRYSTWKGQRMYLEDILVTERYRWKGVGKILFDKLISVAREKKFSGMTWQVLEWNEPAIRFYEKYHAKLDGEWINCSIELSGN